MSQPEPEPGSHERGPREHSSPFASLADFVAIPRIGSLAPSADGTRLAVAGHARRGEEEVAVRALGGRPGRGSVRPPADPQRPGRVLPAWPRTARCCSPRPGGPRRQGGGRPEAALWSLPPGGGEARPVLTRPGGSAFAVALESGDVVVPAATMPGGLEAEEDEERRKQRKDAGVSAILHEVYPVRYWDHDLGPAVPHAFWAGQLPAEEPGGGPVALRDLTPDAGPPDGAGEGLPTLTRRPAARPDRGRARRAGGAPVPPRADRDRERRDPSARRRPAGRRLRPRASPPTARPWSASARRCRPTPTRRTTRCCSSTSRPARCRS